MITVSKNDIEIIKRFFITLLILLLFIYAIYLSHWTTCPDICDARWIWVD